MIEGHSKLEGKFDAFNRIWGQEIGDLKSKLDDIKNEVHDLNDKVDINTSVSDGFTNMSDRFVKLENKIENLAFHRNEKQLDKI